MKKSEIIQKLKALPFAPDQYWLLFDTAKVFRGMQSACGAIHIGCTGEMADALKRKGI